MEERPDIALENDRQEGVKRDNYYAGLRIEILTAGFAESPENAWVVSEVVRNLVQAGGGILLDSIDSFYFDMSLAEAAQAACIDAITPANWDAPLTALEDINVIGVESDMNQYEIIVELFQSED